MLRWITPSLKPWACPPLVHLKLLYSQCWPPRGLGGSNEKLRGKAPRIPTSLWYAISNSGHATFALTYAFRILLCKVLSFGIGPFEECLACLYQSAGRRPHDILMLRKSTGSVSPGNTSLTPRNWSRFATRSAIPKSCSALYLTLGFFEEYDPGRRHSRYNVHWSI